MTNDIELYFHLVSADLRAQMQYKLSFVLFTLGTFLALMLEFAVIFVLFGRFPSLLGWTVGEVAFLYGLASVSFSLAEMVCGGFDHFASLIRQGGFDRILTRPVDPFVQICGLEFSLRRLGRLGPALVAILIAQGMVGVTWTLPKLLYLPLVVASGACVFGALFILGATLCFWTVETTEVVNIFTHGGNEMISYPLTIYQDWLRRFFIFVVPLAFVTYFPSLYFLARPDVLGMPAYFPFLPPVAAVLFLAVARLAWTAGVRHYQSTGS